MSVLLNRLIKNQKKLKSLLKNWPTNAYRLYDRDIPEYPFMIDCYNGHVLLHDRREEIDRDKNENFNEAKNAIATLFKVAPIIKTRKVQERFDKYSKQGRQSLLANIVEGPATFQCNLSDYIDTGLFLDHRPLRRMIFKESNDKKVLNLFSYTCAISVMAALGGGQVTSIDLSKTYLNWGEQNFKLNNIRGEHRFIRSDVKSFLESSNETYDIIILDPPTFSNSKNLEDTFDVQRDHALLIDLCMKKLDNNGKLYFSNNKRNFKLDPEIVNHYNIQDLSLKSIPEDFRDKKIHQLYALTRG